MDKEVAFKNLKDWLLYKGYLYIGSGSFRQVYARSIDSNIVLKIPYSWRDRYTACQEYEAWNYANASPEIKAVLARTKIFYFQGCIPVLLQPRLLRHYPSDIPGYKPLIPNYDGDGQCQIGKDSRDKFYIFDFPDLCPAHGYDSVYRRPCVECEYAPIYNNLSYA